MENVKIQEGLWRLDCLGKNKSPQKLGTFILMVEQCPKSANIAP